jgi:hypothetical protein
MTNNRTLSFSPTRSVARHTRRIALALLLAMASACSSAVAGGPTHAASKPSLTTPASGSAGSPPTSKTAPAPTTTAVPAVGQQAFSTYQQAFVLLNQLEASPTGRSTDPRLGQLMLDPWYGEVRAGLDELRLKSEVVKGPYSFSKFQLQQVTADGRVVFTDCQTNGQERYDSRTGARVTNTGVGEISEQVVVARGPDGMWRVADRNTGTVNTCGV